MSAEELVDYYDVDGNIIGFCTRQEADDRNLTYPNVIVFIFSSVKRVWIQKRALTKRHYPGLWDTSACGALAHLEDPKAAAERELFEEMQVTSDLQFVEKFLNVFPSEDGNEARSRMSYLYFGICDETPAGNHEVEAVAAFDISQLKTELSAKPADFVPSFDIEFLKALKAYEAYNAGTA